MAAHRYWRIYALTAWGGGYMCGPATIELRDSGGTNQSYAGNGTASALRSYGGYPASNSFTSDPATFWLDTSSAVNWIQWDFGAGNAQDIEQVVMTNPTPWGYSDSAIKNFVIQYSDNASLWIKWASVLNRPNTLGYSSAYVMDPLSTAEVTLPSLIASGAGGGGGGILLPALSAVGYGSALARVTLPRLRAQGFGHNSEGENAGAVRLRGISAGGYCGANAALTLPFIAVSAVGTGTSIGTAEIFLPSLTVSATGTIAATAAGAVILPSLNVIGYSGAVLSVTLGKITATGSGKTGGVGKAVITLPLFEVSATGTVHGLSSGDVTLPAITAAPSGAGWVVLPGFVVTAVGTATVAATYEAYALNLNHTGEKVVDQMTHYTNFPFTHVVRYKNSYYGVAAGGLYLLEGTTDAGAPIAWQFKTGITDFGTANLKTVTYAYFGGRFGPGATVSIYPSESGGNSYSYTTPRGQAAQNYRQQFGRGLKARYFAVGASGTDALELDSLELITDTLSRRI